MGTKLQYIRVKNFRCLREITVPTHGINVLFGPNGVGKSTFLDALWFVRDCAIRGTADASSDRHHGIGALNDGAPESDQRIDIGIEPLSATYLVTFGYSSGRIEPFAAERLVSKNRKLDLIV